MSDDENAIEMLAAAVAPATLVYQVSPSGSAWTECDIEGCRNIARRLVTNTETDELLQVICEAHDEINQLRAEVERLRTTAAAATAALEHIVRCDYLSDVWSRQVAREALAALSEEPPQ